GRRYTTAAALTDDLHRFQRGEPIAARAVSKWEHGWRWVRRNPAGAALILTALSLFGLVVAAGLREGALVAQRRNDTARQEEREWTAVATRLEQATSLQQQGRWPEARVALAAAPTSLDKTAPADLRVRLQQARADADMVAELEEIRLRLSGPKEGSPS